MAPTCGSAHGTTEPTARNFDWTATPHWPASRSHATIEYVATTSLRAIGQLAEVAVAQVAAIGRHERRRNLRMRERGLHGLRRGGSHDDRPPGPVCFVQCPLINDVVEHERLVEVELAVDRDLRDPSSRCTEPALPHSSIVPPGSTACTSTPLARRFSSSGDPARSGNVP